MTKIKNKQILVASDFDFNGKKASNLANPTAPQDAVTLAYLTSVDGGTMTKADKNRASAVTAGNGQTTDLTITNQPKGSRYVEVMVNGIQQSLGDGVKTKDCYFSVDGGVTARAISAITAADTLYWNGVIAGYDLDATDFIDMNYEA